MQPAMVHESILETRRRLGHDRFDEVWEGVLHMVPFPTTRHQRVETELLVAFAEIARPLGLYVFGRTAIYDPAVSDDSDYRGPDVMVTDRRHISRRGVEGNALVLIEIVSPGDESRDKLPFYARNGVREVWLLDPRAWTIEILVLDAGKYRVSPPVHGVALSLDVRLEGSMLRVVDGDRVHAIDLHDDF